MFFTLTKALFSTIICAKFSVSFYYANLVIKSQSKPYIKLGNYPMTMLIKNLRGAPALSDFRVKKLLA
ncbi:MAG: hypothetical protein ACI9U5_001833, partial [Colwellia sp.]